MVDVGGPVLDRPVDAAGAVSACSLMVVPSRPHSSMLMAYSGQLATASRAFSSSSGGHRAVADDDGLAVVVDVEQLGRQCIAPVVPLALLGIDPYLHATIVRRPERSTAVPTLRRCRRSSRRRRPVRLRAFRPPTMPRRSRPTGPIPTSPATRAGRRRTRSPTPTG